MNPTLQLLPERIAAVLEIAAGGDEELRPHLLSAAYRTSGRGIVVLVLRGISRGEMDRMLDPVVRATGLGVEGVMYLDADDETRVALAVERSRFVVPCSPALHQAARNCGAVVMDTAQAVEALARPPEPARAANSAAAALPSPGSMRVA